MIQPVRRNWARARVLATALICLAFSGSATADDSGEFRGRSLAEALARLESRGLRIVYNNELVRPGMTVATEPPPGEPREILDYLLGPHGLESRDGPGGTVLVVRAVGRGELRGIVRDRQSSWPLAGARVIVSGVRLPTREDGSFGAELEPGTYSVKAVRSGYLPATLDVVEIVSGKVARVVLELTPMSVSFEEIVVSAEGDAARSTATGSRLNLDENAMRNVPNIADDALRAVEALPGVAARDESAAPNIRGGAADETLILLDGMELYEPFHLRDVRGFSSIIDSRTVGSLEYLNGGFPAKYGGRMSGVLDVTSRAPAEKPEYGVGLSSDQSWVRGEGRFRSDRGRWLGSARTGYPRESLERLGARFESNPGYYDLFAKVGFDVSPRTSLALHVLASRDELGRPGSSDGAPVDSQTFGSRYDNRYVWLGLRQNWAARLVSRTVLAFSKLSRLRDGRAPDLSVRDERVTRVLEVKQDWILVVKLHTVKSGWNIKNLRAGYDYRSLAFDESGSPEPARTFAVHRRPKGADASAYVSDHVRIRSFFDVEFGLRFDLQDYAENEDRTLSPRIHLAYRPGPQSTIRWGWGRYYQPQRIDELQIEDGVDRFFPAQSSEHFLLNYDRDFADGMQLRVGLYRNRITRLHPRFENLFDPLGVLPEAASDRVMIAPDAATARGFEVLLRSRTGQRWSWTAAYTFASVEDLINGADVPRTWDQRHTLSGGLGLDLGRWLLNLVGTFHTGRPTTPVAAQWVTLPDGSQEIIAVPLTRNSERFPSYNRVDLRVQRGIPYDRGEIQLWLQVLNLFDHRNNCCVDGFDFGVNPDGSPAVEPVRRDGLSRTMAAGVAWTF